MYGLNSLRNETNDSIEVNETNDLIEHLPVLVGHEDEEEYKKERI